MLAQRQAAAYQPTADINVGVRLHAYAQAGGGLAPYRVACRNDNAERVRQLTLGSVGRSSGLRVANADCPSAILPLVWLGHRTSVDRHFMGLGSRLEYSQSIASSESGLFRSPHTRLAFQSCVRAMTAIWKRELTLSTHSGHTVFSKPDIEPTTALERRDRPVPILCGLSTCCGECPQCGADSTGGCNTLDAG
jgi:hypothetical protein